MTKQEDNSLKPLSIIEYSLENYDYLWQSTRDRLSWHCPFVLPFWLKTVRRHLGNDGRPLIFVARDDRDIVGIIPMALNGRSAGFLGPHHVCDYQDMAVIPGYEEAVASALLTHLKDGGLDQAVFRTLRPDAYMANALSLLSEEGRHDIHREPDEVTFEIQLPTDWDGYLLHLNGKQRHEVRRKIRRLEAESTYAYRTASNAERPVSDFEIFIDLFRKNREDKARFMGPTMEAYFKDLLWELAERDLLSLNFLEVNDQPTAAVFCFDYNGTRYLYNSGYDRQFDDLSVGILSKVFSIQNAVQHRLRRYDFLKGEEVYKGRIGGIQVPLYQYHVRW